MLNIKKIIAITLLFININAYADNKFHHEINYGLINFDSFEIFNANLSHFPVFGATYRYYIEPLSGKLPSHLEAHIERKSWLQVDANLLTGFSLNVGGVQYFAESFSIEYDLTRITSRDYNGSEDDFTLLTDLVLNKRLNKNWQVGFGLANIVDYDDNYDGYHEIDSEFNSNTIPTVTARYTKINKGQGWDISGRLVTKSDYYSLSGKIRLLADARSIYKGTFSYSVFDDQFDGEEAIVQFSLSKERWFSKRGAIDYGLGALTNDNLGSWVHFFELNGKYRF